MNRKVYISSLDFSKFVMSIVVIAIHTNPLTNCNNKSILTIYSFVTQMAVPIFFLISGYLLAIKLMDHTQPQMHIFIVSKYLRNIIKMYVIWSIIYLPLAIYGYYLAEVSISNAIISYIKGLVFVGEHYNSWHLWYLLSTIYALGIVLILLHMRINLRYMVIISVLVSIISIGINELITYSGDLSNILFVIKCLVANTIVNGRILQGIIYIPIGMFMANKKSHKMVCVIIFAVCFVINYYFTSSVLRNCSMIFAPIALFEIIRSMTFKKRAVYSIMRRLSVKVYFIHMYIWTFFYLFKYGEKRYGWDSFVITTIISFVVGYIYLICETRIKESRLK